MLSVDSYISVSSSELLSLPMRATWIMSTSGSLEKWSLDFFRIYPHVSQRILHGKYITLYGEGISWAQWGAREWWEDIPLLWTDSPSFSSYSWWVKNIDVQPTTFILLWCGVFSLECWALGTVYCAGTRKGFDTLRRSSLGSVWLKWQSISSAVALAFPGGRTDPTHPYHLAHYQWVRRTAYGYWPSWGIGGEFQRGPCVCSPVVKAALYRAVRTVSN